MIEKLRPPIVPILIGLALALLCVIGYETGQIVYDDHVRKAGTFWTKLLSSPPNEIGDTLAGVFGSLAFAAAAVAVAMQSFELKAQRDELKQTRDVLREQRQEASTQNKSVKEQIHDNTFFQMLSALSNIISDIDLEENSESFMGRDCFRENYKKMKVKLNTSLKQGYKVERYDRINAAFFDNHAHEFGHYFRFLYNFFRFLDESEETKPHHIKILRSYLSDYETLLVFYNCLTPKGGKFCHYLSKYEVFDNIAVDKLVRKDDLSRYAKKAFGENPEYRNWQMEQT